MVYRIKDANFSLLSDYNTWICGISYKSGFELKAWICDAKYAFCRVLWGWQCFSSKRPLTNSGLASED